MPFPPSILQVVDQFLLFRVDRDYRVPCCQERLCLCIEVFELPIPVWMLSSRPLLARALLAVAQLMQQLTH
jgi:hypothetical protein